jgi:hypothetical protein
MEGSEASPDRAAIFREPLGTPGRNRPIDLKAL